MGKIIYKVNSGCKTHPQWAYNSVIYELNMRQFTPKGTILAATKELERLKALGVDVIWLMPIFPIGNERRKGTLGSYYSIQDYTAVNPEFGTFNQLCKFVNTAHSLDIKVIIDWVANHTSRDAKWTIEHPDWYEFDAAVGEIATPFDWSDTAKLDYNNQEMRTEMINSMKFWVEKAGIDGFRCDMAMLVPLDFWERATRELIQIMPDGRELFMLAEAEGAEFHRAFDATYCWEEHHIINRLAKSEVSCFDLGGRLEYENSQYDNDALRMHFTSNHDENSWNGSAIERLGDSAESLAALTFMLSGMPLIYNGQEAGLDHRLEFFEKDSINWKGLRKSQRSKDIEALYTNLCELKHTHPALMAGRNGGDIIGLDNDKPAEIFAIQRKVADNRVVIAIFNFTGNPQEVTIYDEEFRGEFTLFGSDNSVTLSPCEKLYLKSWGFQIYYK
ncbi:MAG: alpha-amylase family glycosyl hydrolase [Rikenellaceae bacterium]